MFLYLLESSYGAVEISPITLSAIGEAMKCSCFVSEITTWLLFLFIW